MSERDVQKLADIFEGVFFDPVSDDLDDALSETRVNWVVILDDSTVAGRTIGEADIRTQIGVSVLAVK